MMPYASYETELYRAVQLLQVLTSENLALLYRIYAPDAYFKDPFNEVRGIMRIGDIYRHMFEQVDRPRFMVATQLLHGADAFLTWDFLFHMKRPTQDKQCIHGATHLRFDTDGKIRYQRDYWDTAEALNEKLS